jgi:hypothetical protein
MLRVSAPPRFLAPILLNTTYSAIFGAQALYAPSFWQVFVAVEDQIGSGECSDHVLCANPTEQNQRENQCARHWKLRFPCSYIPDSPEASPEYQVGYYRREDLAARRALCGPNKAFRRSI